jgi:hypothetical protein
LKSLSLLFWSAVAYSVALFLTVSVFPSVSTSTLPFTGIPLILIAAIIARNLARRSTIPAATKTAIVKAHFKGSPVQFLSGQIKVGAESTNAYFENILRARLRELMISKVALETGVESQTVRRLLSDPREGRELLHDKAIYDMLYGPTPRTGRARMDMIDKAVDLIGAWKG